MLFQISFYVPESHLKQVKEAMFAEGAGKIGQYNCCAFQFKGKGQFRPLPGSIPYKGELNQIETLTEYKVEMICEKQYLHAAIEALKRSHPYEKPVYMVLKDARTQ